MIKYNNPRHNKAALILAAMSNDMVRDIIDLINYRGASLISELNANSHPAPGFLAIFSDDYINSEDFPEVWTGFATIALSSFRNPKYSAEVYAGILKQAYNLPSGMATALAHRIETEDILGGTKGDVSMWQSIKNNLTEGARKLLNSLAASVGLPWEIDQNQDYDIDFLYELKLLGQVVNELNSRARLMQSQAMLASSMHTLMTSAGDVEEGDVVDLLGDPDLEIGDLASLASLRRLPGKVFGGLKGIQALGSKAATAQAVKHSGGSVARPALSSHPRPKLGGMLKSALTKFSTGSAGKAGLVGAGLGLIPTALMLGSALFKKKRGDVDSESGDVYDTIAEEFGDSVADAWSVGDVDTITQHMMRMAMADSEDGDPDDDAYIISELERLAAEGVDDQQETGGLFTRWRINRNKRRAERRADRAYKRRLRRAAKSRRRRALADSKYAADVAGLQDEGEQTDLVNQYAPTTETPLDGTFSPQDEQMMDPGTGDGGTLSDSFYEAGE